MTEESLFAAALEKPAGPERQAFLDAACAGDAALRERVERLLAADARTRGILDHGADPAATESYQTTPPLAPDELFAGRFKLRQKIGEGGMGEVWVADQSDPVRRRVAVKVIRPGLDSDRLLARFEAERQALALMDHPNIAKFLDAGVAGGRPYFVMELIKGVPITRYCDEARLDARERVELFAHVCRAVQHAHQKGVIHRDLKPSNVLVALYDGRPVVKVIDFGVAKAVGPRLGEHSVYTEVGSIVGTLEYMSPEQAELNNLDIDTRADVYALGAVLYELLTGVVPFPRQQLIGSGLAEMLRLIKEVDPPKPSTRLSGTATAPGVAALRRTEPRRLAAVVRGELDWIVMKALAKDRNRRYESAVGLAHDLERYLADEPVSAGPPSAAYRLRKFARRHRLLLGTAAAFVGLLVTGVVTSTWQAVRATRAEVSEGEQRKQAERNEQDAKDERNKAVDATAAATIERNKAVEAGQKTAAALKEERFTAYTHRVALAHREWLAGEVARARQLLDDCPPDLRDWEWRYVRRLCNSELAAFRDRVGDIKGLAFSPDGSRVVSVGARTCVWDAATGRELLSIPGRAANRGAFSPDGKRLAVAGFQVVAVHDAADGRVLARITAHDFQVLDVAFSPDGKRLATAGAAPGGKVPRKGEVKVWDVETGQAIHQFADLLHWATSVAFSPDGRYLAAGTGLPAVVSGSGGSDRPPEVRVWDVEDGKLLHTLRGHTYWVMDVAFNGDGTRLASAGADETVRVWELPAGRETLTLRGHHGWVRAVAFNSTGDLLASAGDDRVVRVWDATGKEVDSLRGHTRPVLALAFSPDGHRLASCDGGGPADRLLALGQGARPAGEVRIWDAAAGQQSRVYREGTSGATNVVFSPDSRLLAWSGWNDGVVREVATGVRWPGSLIGAKSIAFSPDGATVGAVGFADKKVGVILWSSGTAAEVRHLPYSFNAYGSASLAINRDGRVAALAGSNLTVWDVATGREVHQGRPHEFQGSDVAFSPDGRRFATSSPGGARGEVVDGVRRPKFHGGEVKVWDATTYKELMTLPGGGLGLAFSPDGSRLASGGQDGTVSIWDVDTGKVLVNLRWQDGPVSGVAFSPDGKRLVTGAADRTVKVWDALNGREVLALRGHDDPVTGVAFSPDGRYLASTSGSIAAHGQVRLWDARPVEP